MLITQHDRHHTYFCLTMAVLLFLSGFVLPASVATTGIMYKVRELLLVLAIVSFVWTWMQKKRIWEFSFPRKMITYVIAGFLLAFLTGGMLLYHGIEERTERQLQGRPYQKK